MSTRPMPAPDGPTSVWRGLRGRCPRCGDGRLFGRYLKVAPACSECGQALHHHRADDFPPYIVMFIVCHVVGYGIYTAETRFEGAPTWLHAALWPSLAIGLSLALLQPVKGAVVALQYALGMHGFGERAPVDAEGSRLERGSRDTAHGLRDERRAQARMAEPEAP